MDHDVLVRGWLKRRAQRDALRHEYEAADAAIKTEMEEIEMILHGSLLENHQQSMGVKGATVYLEKTIKPSCTDWFAYRKFMVENDALDGVEKRVSKLFIKDFMEGHNDETPPGIAVLKEQVVRIRTKTT